jgi:hypothetical protein
MFITEDKLLNLAEVARVIGLHRNTVQKYAILGKLPFPTVLFGERHYVRLSELQAFTRGAQRRSAT